MNAISIIVGVLCFFIGCWMLFIHQIYYQKIEKGKRPGFAFTLKMGGIGLIVIGVVLLFKSCS